MRPGTALSLVLLGLGVPAYLLTINHLDLPDRGWVIFCVSGLVLGFAVGRGWAPLGALAIVPVFWSTGPGAAEGNGYLIMVFLPLAILSIAVGYWRTAASLG